MLVLSPHLISSTYGLESMIDVLHDDDLFASYSTQKESETSFNSTSSSQLPGFETYDEDLHSLGLPNKSHPKAVKKSSHNAYERDRRRKLNSLYSSLRSLIPDSDQHKRLSIPSTVGRVLKYIPELQRQVERLIRRKEEILLRVSKEHEPSSSAFVDNSKGEVYPVVSATCLNDKEVMVQMCILNKSSMIPLSKIVKVLEGEGLRLLNASTLATHAERAFYSLHFQTNEATNMECHNYCGHLVRVLRDQARTDKMSYCLQTSK